MVIPFFTCYPLPPPPEEVRHFYCEHPKASEHRYSKTTSYPSLATTPSATLGWGLGVGAGWCYSDVCFPDYHLWFLSIGYLCLLFMDINEGAVRVFLREGMNTWCGLNSPFGSFPPPHNCSWRVLPSPPCPHPASIIQGLERQIL